MLFVKKKGGTLRLCVDYRLPLYGELYPNTKLYITCLKHQYHEYKQPLGPNTTLLINIYIYIYIYPTISNSFQSSIVFTLTQHILKLKQF